MPVPHTYPGVYIEEIPSGSRTITGVATAVAAFVGRAPRGPVDEPVQIGSFAEFERAFGGLWRESGLGYAVRDYYLNGGSEAVVVRLAGENAETAAIDVDGKLLVEASGPGQWGNGLAVEIEHPEEELAKLTAAEQGVKPEDLFQITIREGSEEEPRLVEAYPNVTLVDGPRRVDTVLASSQLVGEVELGESTNRPAQGKAGPGVYVPPAAEPAKKGEGEEKPKGEGKEPKEEKGKGAAAGRRGADGEPLEADDYTGEGMDGANEGLYALRRTDIFTLLSLPPSSPEGELPEELWDSALKLCVERRAMLLVDPPPAKKTVDNVKKWIGEQELGADGRNAVFYFPRIRRADPLRDGAIREFVPSGAVAGVMARTDATRGVWKAPAGLEAGVSGASGLAVPLTDAENGRLNPFAINSLRTFPTIGTVVWGARTLRGADVLADEYKYVPVRRLALFLEETLFRSTQWAVFEPNDEPLWSQLRTSIGAFMQDLFRQGAFQGSSPRDAYFVHCNSDTTTQYDVDRGIVNVVVGFAPLKPAEFVVVSIQQKTAAAAA